MKKVLPVLLLLLLLFLPHLAFSEADGKAGMEVSAEKVRIGDVVDIRITGAEGATCVYQVKIDGKQVFSGAPDEHLSVSYRPRSAGAYEILAEVTQKTGAKEKVACTFTVTEDVRPEQEDIYSQRDGWWKDKSYRDSTLDQSGCAIFALSHALSRMGIEDASSLPSALGKTYASCLITGGTSVVRLINQAAEAYGFQTKSDLLENKNQIQKQFQDGAMFSFSIVFGHIALATEMTEDGKKVQVVDSAPTVTLSRIKKGGYLYFLDDKGKFQKITDLSQVPGSRYYFETQEFGGLTYYMDFSYVAGRGVRLIKPYQLMLNEDGRTTPVEMITFGTVLCEVTKTGKKTMTVSTEDLDWRRETEQKLAAFVTGTKSVTVKDGKGKKVKTVPGRTVMQVLASDDERVRVRYDGTTGFVDRKSVDLIDLNAMAGKRGTLSLNGNVSGRAKIKVRITPGGKVLDEYPTGTPLVLFSEAEETYEIEIEGRRGYVQKEFVTLE